MQGILIFSPGFVGEHGSRFRTGGVRTDMEAGAGRRLGQARPVSSPGRRSFACVLSVSWIRYERTLSVRLSVIIPAWNEELWLPRLLRRLRLCDAVTEVIVADNDSRDGTARVAREAGCRVVPGGLPARARNRGAEAASGDILLFLDADAVIERTEVLKLLRHFERPEVAAVHCRLVPIDASPFVRFCYSAADVYFRALARLGGAQAIGSCMVVRRECFVRAGGFREDIAVGEDADLYRRLRLVGKVTYDRSARVHVSPRRFAIENPAVFAGKCLVWAALRAIGSRRSLLPYRWRGYPESLAFSEHAATEARMPSARPLAIRLAKSRSLRSWPRRVLPNPLAADRFLLSRLAPDKSQPVPRITATTSSARTMSETVSMKISALRK